MLGSLISAGASIIGGLMGKDSADDAQESQEKMAAQNAALQKEFAQHGIRWKVADAKAAGLHPLAALGSNTISYTPQQVGGGYSNHMGEALSNAGQDISRAIHATRTAEERAEAERTALARQSQMDAINLERHKADLAHMGLQNAYLASQIRRLNQETPPPMPRSLDTSKGIDAKRYAAHEFQPSKITSANPFHQSRTAGPPGPATTRYRFGGPYSGFYTDLPAGSSVSEGLESMGSAYSLYTMGRHHLSNWIDENLYDDRGRFLGGLRRLFERPERR